MPLIVNIILMEGQGQRGMPENWCVSMDNPDSPDHVSFDAAELNEVKPDGTTGKYFETNVPTGGPYYQDETNCTITVNNPGNMVYGRDSKFKGRGIGSRKFSDSQKSRRFLRAFRPTRLQWLPELQ